MQTPTKNKSQWQMFDIFSHPVDSQAKCKVIIMETSFHSCANKSNFHKKSFALCFAFIMKFTATRTWPIQLGIEVCRTQTTEMNKHDHSNSFVCPLGLIVNVSAMLLHHDK